MTSLNEIIEEVGIMKEPSELATVTAKTVGSSQLSIHFVTAKKFLKAMTILFLPTVIQPKFGI